MNEETAENDAKTIENDAKTIEKRTRRRIKDVDLDTIHLKFLIVLEREVNSLMDASYGIKLSEENAKDLVNYLKLLKELKDMEIEKLQGLSDEELAKRAQIAE